MNYTLPLYLARRFVVQLLLVFGATLLVVVLGDLVELSREAGSRGIEDAPLLSMAFLHAPSVLNKGLPFVFLIAALTTFLGLARSSELVVLRAAGLSAWLILGAPVLLAVVLGVASFSVYNPVSAITLKQYERLDIKYFRGQDSLLSISRTGLWLRQANEAGNTVIHANRASGDGTELIGVTMYVFDGEGAMVEQIIAPSARLTPGAWQIADADRWSITQSDEGSVSRLEREVGTSTIVATDLTSNIILESFADPNALSFWDLSGFIETLELSGFSAVRHRLYMQTELSKPLLFAAMVLIGAGFSMRHVRFGGSGVMILGCVTSGFALFFLADIAEALGASGALPVPIAAWVVPVSALLYGAGLLFNLEDG
ncbi:MAG: LPS export ABC transporter permease LptG [Pseudomonadota bacterium]